MKKDDYIINGFSLEKIRNTYETRVIQIMRAEMDGFSDFDQCQICIEDVYALSLSRIPPTYVQPGSIIFKKDLSDDDVREVVRYAFFQVMQQPKHS